MVPRYDADRSVQTDSTWLKAILHVLVRSKEIPVQFHVEDTLDAEEILRLIAREEFGKPSALEADRPQLIVIA